MKYWNKMIVTFQDDTQIICDKVLFDGLVPFSSGSNLKTPSFRLIIDGELDTSRSFKKRDIKEVSPIHGVPLLITVVYYDKVYEFLKNDLSRQEQWSQNGLESFHEAYWIPFKIQYHRNQVDYNSLIHNEVERNLDNFNFMNSCPKVSRVDDVHFLLGDLFPNRFLNAVFEEGIALYGTAVHEKCYLYSIEPLFLQNPETLRVDLSPKPRQYFTRNHYDELSGIIDLSNKTIQLKSNTEEWVVYSSRRGEDIFYKDFLTYFERLSTRHLCVQLYEQILEKCILNRDVDVKSEKDVFQIAFKIISHSPIDWEEELSIHFEHHPSQY